MLLQIRQSIITISTRQQIIPANEHDIIVCGRIVFGTGLFGLASAWLLTSGMVLWAFKNSNNVQHREWIIKT